MKAMYPVLVIYHGNCADGFGAAWAVHKAIGDEGVEYYGGVYQQNPPNCNGKIVVFVDFCYKPDVMEIISQQAQSILILDHHKSAMEGIVSAEMQCNKVDLSKYEGRVDWRRYLDNVYQDYCENAAGVIYYIFDMNRSGAMITWQFFHDADPPALITHIQDRDLWKFQLPHTREIQAAIFSEVYEFAVWDDLMAADMKDLAIAGTAIEKKHHKDIAELLKVCQREMTIGGISVPVASLPYTMVSDAAHIMATDRAFAACYWDTEKTRIFGLRSHEGGTDVSQIAAMYGGGGHKNAAGFSVPRDHELAQA